MNESLSIGLAPSSLSNRILPQPHSVDGTEERTWLLRRLLIRGPQTTTVDFALRFIFPDMPAVSWANANNVAVECYSLYCNWKPIPFIRFTLKEETPEKMVNDWYEQMKQRRSN